MELEEDRSYNALQAVVRALAFILREMGVRWGATGEL